MENFNRANSKPAGSTNARDTNNNINRWRFPRKNIKMGVAILLVLALSFWAFFWLTAGTAQAGITPESPLYFLDKISEDLRQLVTLNPDSKARLHIAYAGERVAEIKIILDAKGIEAEGLEVAQARLREHLGEAAEIVIKQKNKGEDVSQLAKQLNDDFKEPKSALSNSFKAWKRALETREDELEDQMKAAHKAGDTAKTEALAEELGQVKTQLELLELKEEKLEDELEEEEEKLEEEMNAQQKAEEAIREAEEEKQETVEEAAEERVELPADAFVEFDALLAQAKNAYDGGNYQEAKRLAKQAEISAEKLDKKIDRLEERKEAEEAIKEAEAKKQEVINEAAEEGIEIPTTAFTKFDRLLSQARELFAKENYQGAEELAEQAEEVLEDVDKEIEKAERQKQKQEEQADEEKDNENSEEDEEETT